jgi:predicted  nucleic acid-binding Zn-ribbon protein
MKKVLKTLKKKETEFEVLARLMQNGFSKIDEKFTKIDQRFDKIDEKFTKIDQRFDKIDERFEKIDARFDLVDSQLFSINHELKDHGQRLDRIERKQVGVLMKSFDILYC